MSSHKIQVEGEHGTSTLTGMEPTTFERFRDARHHIDQRNEREITNHDVLSLLLDVWWYHEREHAREVSHT